MVRIWNKEAYKKKLLANWKWKATHEGMLWGNSASMVYRAIKNKSPREAYKYLKRNWQKYKSMSSSAYFVRAMNQIKPLMRKKRKVG